MLEMKPCREKQQDTHCFESHEPHVDDGYDDKTEDCACYSPVGSYRSQISALHEHQTIGLVGSHKFCNACLCGLVRLEYNSCPQVTFCIRNSHTLTCTPLADEVLRISKCDVPAHKIPPLFNKPGWMKPWCTRNRYDYAQMQSEIYLQLNEIVKITNTCLQSNQISQLHENSQPV